MCGFPEPEETPRFVECRRRSESKLVELRYALGILEIRHQTL